MIASPETKTTGKVKKITLFWIIGVLEEGSIFGNVGHISLLQSSYSRQQEMFFGLTCLEFALRH